MSLDASRDALGDVLDDLEHRRPGEVSGDSPRVKDDERRIDRDGGRPVGEVGVGALAAEVV
jgi:hypothetical protein